MSSDEEIIAAAIDFVKAELSGNDASHDWQHIERVWTLAKRIHKDEGGEADGTVVQIGALLHDIREKKYGYSENAGAEAAVEFLTAKSFAPERIDKVVHVIKNISYRSEITGNTTRSPELDIVQDADRLDAVGAIGIARCFSYGGFKKRPLYTSSICMTEADADQHVRTHLNDILTGHFRVYSS
eukprot:TRINITY_DN4592_c0_g1_i5.p2 TRINITY_DN4592_c0_g1~~TRINITY_DN4592_c0_g1_i5.p2  ORF type:complete len:184 (-),score=52.25 TRINITY_DN4592_c0_g1_i5:565-1116(-)